MYRTDDTHPHRHDHGHDHDHGSAQDGPFRGRGRGRRGGFRGPQDLEGLRDERRGGRRGFGPEGRGGSFGQAVFGLLGAARAAAHGDETQKARVEAILADARRSIFSVLAEAGNQPAESGNQLTDPETGVTAG
jgi:hypothetical protein